MKTVKKTVVVYVDIQPIDHKSHQPYPQFSVYAGERLPEGAVRQAFEIELDVPVRYEELPAAAVKEVKP